ncbi:MAG: dihydrodipicolinate synthase family protein [Prevotellaceae bacterium]|nr:dihydrodipicolinate synthase family protein [Prevotellaceae bacterium]
MSAGAWHTGESASVSAEESRRLVAAVVRGIGGKAAIFAGISGCCVQQNIENAKAYLDLGVDVIASVLPYYYALAPDQMTRYYEQLAEAIPRLMVYNIPATTHMSIPLEVIRKLSDHPNICGLKDSERDAQRMEMCVEMFREREDFSYFLGYAALSAAALRLGADGIVPSTGNFVPEMFRQLYDFAAAKKFDECERLQAETNEIAQLYQAGRTLGQSLAALKTMMSCAGLCEPNVLPPLANLTAAERQAVVRATKQIMKL